MKKLLYIVATVLINSIITLNAGAQTASVSGKIISKTNEPLIGATVALLHLPDSARTAAQMADINGAYRFTTVKPGSYVIKASMTGFTAKLSTNFDVKGNIEIPAITLSETAHALKEVTVTSLTPRLEQKSDRLVVNVEKLNTTGDNALEVLKKAPGVRLDKDDNILYRNNAGVLVMIDGKRTYMSGSELSNYLKNLPGNIISKIELIPNPPANYDAEGTAGIINIVMKRNKVEGMNGTSTLTTGYGTYGRVSGGINLNYNAGKLSTYVRANGGYSSSYNELKLGRTIGTELYSQRNYWHPTDKTASYTVGADYFAGKRHTFGVMFRGYNNPGDANVTSTSVTTNSAGIVTGGVNMTKPQQIYAQQYATNFNYAFDIDTAGQKLTFDGDYIHSNSTNSEQFFNTYVDGNGTQVGNVVELRNNNPASANIRSLKLDYVLPFAKTWRFETGWKSSWVSTDNDARFDSLKAGNWVVDPKRTNHFLYNENINAGYLTFNKTIGKKLEFKAGLRAEQTVSTANSISSGIAPIKRNYWTWVPSVFATYRVNEDNQLNASYSGRISRPGYSSLNPFTFYTDPYTAIKGNPFLQPAFSKSFQFNYTYKSFQILSLSYIHVSNAETNVITQNDVTKESTSQPLNLGIADNLSATSSGSFNIKKWWNVSLELDGSYDKINTNSPSVPYSTSRFSWSGNAEQTFIMPKNFKVQLTAMYYSPSVSGLAKVLSGSQIDAAASKTFMDKKATISFKARDIFFGNRFRSVQQYNNINTTWQNEWESRRFSVSFTYSFGNTKIKAARSRNTGASAEENRL